MNEKSRNLDTEVFDDIGFVMVHPEIIGRDTLAEEPSEVAGVYELPARRSELVVRNFIEHPRRDVAVSALAIGGVGFAAAAIRSRHHH